MWRQKLAIFVSYVALLFVAARSWEWYCYGVLAVASLPHHLRILDPWKLNVKKVRAVLDHRGLVYAGIFEKHQLLNVLRASGRVTAEELADAEDSELDHRRSDAGGSEETKVDDSAGGAPSLEVVFTGVAHFNELVEDCKDSIWLVNVVLVEGGTLGTGVWQRLKTRLSPFGVRFGTYHCRVDPSHVRRCMRRLRKRGEADTDKTASAPNVANDLSPFDAQTSLESSFEHTFPLPLALAIVFVYTLACAFIFSLWEDGWDYFTSFYFFFVSLSTIGLGDEMPQHPRYALSCFFFFIVGLSLLSMCVSVMHARIEAQYMAALELIDVVEAANAADRQEAMIMAAHVGVVGGADDDQPPPSSNRSAPGSATAPSDDSVVWRHSLRLPIGPAGPASPGSSNHSPLSAGHPSQMHFPPAVLGVLMASNRRSTAYRDSILKRQLQRHSTASQNSGGSADEVSSADGRQLRTSFNFDDHSVRTRMARGGETTNMKQLFSPRPSAAASARWTADRVASEPGTDTGGVALMAAPKDVNVAARTPASSSARRAAVKQDHQSNSALNSIAEHVPDAASNILTVRISSMPAGASTE